MAYITQEEKKEKSPKIKAILKKHGFTGSLSIQNYSTLVLSISKGADVFADYLNSTEKDYIEVNQYTFKRMFTGKTLALLTEIMPVLNEGNYNNSDVQSDYFDVGFYVSVSFGKWNKPYQII